MSATGQGKASAVLILGGVLWTALNFWQVFDFLSGRMTLLTSLLDSYIGPVVLISLGFVFLFRVVSARLAEIEEQSRRGGPLAPSNIAIQEQWREHDALEKYFAQMRQWLDDSDAPLDQVPPEHPHYKSAQEDTTRILSRLSPGGKREVVSFLHSRDLIRVGSPIISLVRADLSSANLSGLGLREAEMSYANLRDADLSGAGLCDYLAIGVDLQRMLERGAPQRNFSQPINVSRLIWSDLSGAVFRQARLGGCVFQSADFANADLDEADLRAADLRRARNLTQEQIEKAYGSKDQEDVEDTLLPGELKAPELWKWSLSQQQAMRQSKS